MKNREVLVQVAADHVLSLRIKTPNSAYVERIQAWKVWLEKNKAKFNIRQISDGGTISWPAAPASDLVSSTPSLLVSFVEGETMFQRMREFVDELQNEFEEFRHDNNWNHLSIFKKSGSDSSTS